MITPMKLTDEDLGSVERLVNDPAYCFEQKMDGARAMVHIDLTKTGLMFNWLSSGGGPLKFAAAKQHFKTIEAELTLQLQASGAQRIVLDGELMIEDGEYRVFDMPELVTRNGYLMNTDRPYASRRATLQSTMATFGPVTIVDSVDEGSEKMHLWIQANEQGVEGVVAKRLDAPYLPGTRTKSQLKLKLVKTADVVVIERRAKPNSAVLGVFPQSMIDNNERFDGLLGLQVIGSTSMIGKGDVKAGDVIEVNYLYWTGDAMIQPRMMRKRRREEKMAHECADGQFPAYSRKAVAL